MAAMSYHPWQFLLVALAGWANRHQQDVIAYLHERNHPGVENRLLEAGPEVDQRSGRVECHQRLGGLLRYYHRGAA
jgi:hypothetical protein